MSFAVAYSGGADSTALLLMLARKYPGQVQAIHIHHGLQAAADDFAAHCTAFCTALGVPVHVVHVDARALPGKSPEEAARHARYAALGRKVFELNTASGQLSSGGEAIKTVATAQHADDQVETLLLALSRGAGLPGLSAMPAAWQRDGLQYVRPLLHLSASSIRDWLASEGLSARQPGTGSVGQGWVEDPSNLDVRFTRNRIRHQLMPVLEAAFPHFRETFTRSARHAAEAQRLLVEVAAQDLLAAGIEPRIHSLQTLSQARQANLLRHWLRITHGVSPSAVQLQELQKQIAHCTDRGKRIHIRVASGFVQRQNDVLVYLP
ncbi:MAG: tRNA lysidine(34) synthetase TilS [Polaromonas sp.]|nr:tRNA lysidine(34) synthetase TilS [Polaromonas sp.]